MEALIQELVLLVQRAEEYTHFMASHMSDAVAAEVEQLAAAQRAAEAAGGAGGGGLLRRRLSGPPESPLAAREAAPGEQGWCSCRLPAEQLPR